MEDLTFPVFSKNAVNIYVNAFGEHPIPKEILLEARRLNKPGHSILDKRTRGYRFFRKWADDMDIESEQQFVAGA